MLQECERVGLDVDGVPLIVADVNDSASMNAMCARARVLINCVGPFFKWGEPVVRACVRNKCDYVDITGEPVFIDHTALHYHNAARENGVVRPSPPFHRATHPQLTLDPAFAAGGAHVRL